MIFYIGLFIVLPLIIGSVIYTRMLSTLHEYMEAQVTAQAELLRGLASRRLSVRISELQRVAGYLERSPVQEYQMSDAAAELLQDPNQLSFGILRLDGSSVCGKILNPREYPTIMSAFRGKAVVRYRQDEGLLFAVPIFSSGNIKYVLYEFFNGQTLFEAFAGYCYDGNCDMLLADAIQQVTMPISVNSIGSVSEYFHEEPVWDACQTLSRQMMTSTSATVLCKSANRSDFLFVSEIAQSNLFLLGVIPHDVVAEGIERMLPMVVLVFILLLALLSVGTLRVVYTDAQLQESEELRAAKQAAEEASRSRGQFLASMSHELRTPINTIMGMNELTLRETNEQLTREHSMDIKSAVQILLGLISDVLDFTKIESGQLTVIPAEYNLAILIRDLVLLSEDRARAKSLEFRVSVQPDLPIGLYGDDIRIQQVLANLLTNAVKYTTEGYVLLRITGTRVRDDLLTLHCEVSDTGIGIKSEEIPRMFLPFTRVDEERNRNVEGSGLGLSIITNLLQMMGSHLDVSSVYGQGSTFSFDLEQPVVDGEPIGDIQKRMADMVKTYEYRVNCVAPNARILMVDDNSMNRKIFASLLKPTKISVTTVSSGRRCLDIVQKEHFDIIFMDHLMPEMDGVETLHHLKELQGNLCADSPVIALTANAFNGAQERYLSLGFDGFLSKPVETEKLEIMIRSMLPKEFLEQLPAQPEPEPEEEPLPAVEGVNWDFARMHIRDRDLLLNALQDFYQGISDEYQDISGKMDRIGTEEGLTEYRIQVHALKSTSAMVGILSVSELAKLLEGAAREGRIDRIQLLNPVLLEELLLTEDRLRPLAPTSEKRALDDPTEALMLLDMLRTDMEAMDIGKVDAVMERLRGFAYGPDLQQEVDGLGKLVTNLDYEGAGEAAVRLQDRLMDLTE